jgi:ankyrin repeat protein
MTAAPFRTVLLLCATLAAAAPAVRAEMNLLATDKLIEAIKANDPKTAEELLARGHDANASDDSQRTALMLAAVSGYDDAVALLIRYRASTNTADKFGNSALYYAAAGDNVGTIRLLLAAGADINIGNRQGMTPLMIAAAEGHIGAVQTLIERKADLQATDFTGRTAHDWARRNNRAAVSRVLERAEAAAAGRPGN